MQRSLTGGSGAIGATSLLQLQEELGSIDLRLPDAVISGIEENHRDHPNPSP